MSYLYEAIADEAPRRILDALENGDAVQEIAACREEIRKAWETALDAAGVPPEHRKPL